MLAVLRGVALTTASLPLKFCFTRRLGSHPAHVGLVFTGKKKIKNTRRRAGSSRMASNLILTLDEAQRSRLLDRRTREQWSVPPPSEAAELRSVVYAVPCIPIITVR